MFDPPHTNGSRGPRNAGVAIRWADTDEDGTLAAVAAWDSQRLPAGPWLVAEIEGRALAVLSLPTGSFVADPFSRTTELRALLELRAMQLHSRERRRQHGLGLRRRPRSRAALPSSPPGAGGRLLTLRPRPRY